MKTKVCTKCGKRKPISEYHKDSTKKEGIRNYCKACALEMNRKNKERAKEKKPLHKPAKGEASKRKVAELSREALDGAILASTMIEKVVQTIAGTFGFEATVMVKLQPKKK
ncbi:MAG: hypothetical protein K2O66_03775 [Bacteroidales bacterium]|nr:hypothetical protein [Bacteroidales bacterium]MDE7072469.1 hypothetical protein [Bacteroidales bacterium]